MRIRHKLVYLIKKYNISQSNIFWRQMFSILLCVIKCRIKNCILIHQKLHTYFQFYSSVLMSQWNLKMSGTYEKVPPLFHLWEVFCYLNVIWISIILFAATLHPSFHQQLSKLSSLNIRSINIQIHMTITSMHLMHNIKTFHWH